MTDETGSGRSERLPTQGGDNKASPSTVFYHGAPTDMPAQLGRYLIKKRLGGGGMGAVYLVENTELQRLEALKVPHFESGNDPTVRERFVREARAAAKLDHPNLCAIHDVGVIDGVYFLTMRFLEGKLLATYAGRPHPPREAVKLVAKLAQALEYAHGKGVIHRDLKPSNIMMCPGTGPTVMDFGLAKQTLQQDKKLTQTGMMMGTPAYMPPEQVKGELNLIGPASDVYSLGVIFFELLTGRLPFDGSMAEVMGKVLFTENPLPSQFRPELNRGLDAVCCKAMAKKPEERYASMKEFAATLQELLLSLPAKQEAVQEAAPTRGKNADDIFNMPTVVPEPPPVPKRAPTPSKTMPVEAPKARKPGRRRQDVEAQKLAAQRGSSKAVWMLCLALLLVGGGVFALFLSNGGTTNSTKEKTANSTPIVSKDKDKGVAQANGRPDNEKGANEITNDVDIQMVLIPEGKFTMGSPESEEGHSKDEKEHPVEISSFYLGAHEVTQKQYTRVMGANPSYFSKEGGGKDKVNGMNTDDFPVETVSWEDAMEFCKKLTAMDTKKPSGWVYRLPREAEWEYACRGGVPSQVFHFGNSLSSEQANFDGNHPYGGAKPGVYLERTRKVGSYEKNGFGLYDMHGNAWEWCLDWYDENYYGKSPAKDPPGSLEGSSRVIRGGSWNNFGQDCRSADRGWLTPGDRYYFLGFRVALVPVGRK